ncbi:MAG: alpha/beta hydrolase [Deltaproteobacteria bacterium]|jgi:pimeloyl-ACP methyl ester carboxylesterase|nr:alpha/beta hydrolase [Deltaproteobacteria bacterium]MBW2531784.1 alpha/beta hydrolase [Deltaproteobacteria bacterium]
MDRASCTVEPSDERVAVRVAGVNLKIAVRRVARDADTLLLVHGLGCSMASFDGVWSRPLAERLSVLVPDLPGFGSSSRPERFSYSMEDHAEALVQLLVAVGAGRIHLVAHSMGGAPALLLAERIGPQLASFINVEGNLAPADCGMISRRTASKSFERFRRIGLPALRMAVQQSEQPAMRSFGGWLAAANPFAFWRSCGSLVEWSDSGELLRIFRELRCRRLYVYGERSGLPAVLDELGDVERIAIPDCGHFVMQDAAEAFWPVVEQVVLGGD